MLSICFEIVLLIIENSEHIYENVFDVSAPTDIMSILYVILLIL